MNIIIKYFWRQALGVTFVKWKYKCDKRCFPQWVLSKEWPFPCCWQRSPFLCGVSMHSIVWIGTFHCMDRNIPLYGSEHSTGRHSFSLTSCRTIRGIHKSKHDSYPPRSLPSLNIISPFGSRNAKQYLEIYVRWYFKKVRGNFPLSIFKHARMNFFVSENKQ
jgi:hypothetical protein